MYLSATLLKYTEPSMVAQAYKHSTPDPETGGSRVQGWAGKMVKLVKYLPHKKEQPEYRCKMQDVAVYDYNPALDRQRQREP